MAKTIKFRSFLKIGRGVTGKNNPKKIFAFTENRNSDLQNFPLCSKFFTNYKITQFLHIYSSRPILCGHGKVHKMVLNTRRKA